MNRYSKNRKTRFNNTVKGIQGYVEALDTKQHHETSGVSHREVYGSLATEAMGVFSGFLDTDGRNESLKNSSAHRISFKRNRVPSFRQRIPQHDFSKAPRVIGMRSTERLVEDFKITSIRNPAVTASRRKKSARNSEIIKVYGAPGNLMRRMSSRKSFTKSATLDESRPTKLPLLSNGSSHQSVERLIESLFGKRRISSVQDISMIALKEIKDRLRDLWSLCTDEVGAMTEYEYLSVYKETLAEKGMRGSFLERKMQVHIHHLKNETAPITFREFSTRVLHSSMRAAMSTNIRDQLVYIEKIHLAVANADEQEDDEYSVARIYERCLSRRTASSTNSSLNENISSFKSTQSRRPSNFFNELMSLGSDITSGGKTFGWKASHRLAKLIGFEYEDISAKKVTELVLKKVEEEIGFQNLTSQERKHWERELKLAYNLIGQDPPRWGLAKNRFKRAGKFASLIYSSAKSSSQSSLHNVPTNNSTSKLLLTRTSVPEEPPDIDHTMEGGETHPVGFNMELASAENGVLHWKPSTDLADLVRDPSILQMDEKSTTRQVLRTLTEKWSIDFSQSSRYSQKIIDAAEYSGYQIPTDMKHQLGNYGNASRHSKLPRTGALEPIIDAESKQHAVQIDAHTTVRALKTAADPSKTGEKEHSDAKITFGNLDTLPIVEGAKKPQGSAHHNVFHGPRANAARKKLLGSSKEVSHTALKSDQVRESTQQVEVSAEKGAKLNRAKVHRPSIQSALRVYQGSSSAMNTKGVGSGEIYTRTVKKRAMIKGPFSARKASEKPHFQASGLCLGK